MRISRLNEALRTKVHKIIWFVLRYVLPLAALLYLFMSLRRLPADTWKFWLETLGTNPGWLLLSVAVLMLMPINWMLEAVKWWILAGKLERLSFRKAFAGVLYGLSLGMITPRRTGEIAGRAMLLSPGLRSRGMLINLAGSVCQLGTTLVFGLLALGAALLWYIPSDVTSSGHAMKTVQWSLFPLLALLLLLASVFALRPLLIHYLNKSKRPRWTNKLEVLLQLNRMTFFWLVLLSVGRYLVFMLQFYLLLQLFQFPMPFFEAGMLLALMYLLMTAVPVSALAEAGLRGAAILMIFHLVFAAAEAYPSTAEAALTAAVLGLWLVNLVLPALAGVWVSFSVKLSLNPRVA